jgi:hypothetical protein
MSSRIHLGCKYSCACLGNCYGTKVMRYPTQCYCHRGFVWHVNTHRQLVRIQRPPTRRVGCHVCDCATLPGACAGKQGGSTAGHVFSTEQLSARGGSQTESVAFHERITADGHVSRSCTLADLLSRGATVTCDLTQAVLCQ